MKIAKIQHAVQIVVENFWPTWTVGYFNRKIKRRKFCHKYFLACPCHSECPGGCQECDHWACSKSSILILFSEGRQEYDQLVLDSNESKFLENLKFIILNKLYLHSYNENLIIILITLDRTISTLTSLNLSDVHTVWTSLLQAILNSLTITLIRTLNRSSHCRKSRNSI